jgi:two-component system nitrate/nitrite response regulator NarL
VQSTSPIRILLVDDHRLFRESLRRLLEADTEYRVVAEVATVSEAIELCRGKVEFDLALIDYDLGPTAGARNGVSVLRCLREHRGAVPALMVAAQIQPKELVTVVRDLHTGVFMKADAAEELDLALQKTLRGEVWVSSGLALDLIAGASEMERPDDASINFDSREREVLGLVVEGLSNKEISSRLKLSESVVKSTLQKLFEKVGVRTRAQLVRFAFESGNGLL